MDDAELVRRLRELVAREATAMPTGWEDAYNLYRDAADRIEAMAAQIELWRRNRRETFDAMCAMRDNINEHIPMPSLESDLLQGPEDSVFCATVAEAVIHHASAHAALIAERDRYLRHLTAGAESIKKAAALPSTPAFTAADLEKLANAVWSEYHSSLEEKWTFRKEHVLNAMIADLAQRVKE